ncbi:unnamed protein product [Brachionus calyciflorus]|uniref:Magnesium transporter NIPA2 n=1 Tax=Brachionus calyciflorus TaxID=104777 RepID=A0A814A5J7_9BILA|nr:unnamed protein product [Brachionus calyciflorus]
MTNLIENSTIKLDLYSKISNLTQHGLDESVSSKMLKKNQSGSHEFYIGLSLALLSSFFIGSSFILKKKGLLKLCGSTTLSPNKRAGQGGYGYLKEWLWWSGFLTMAVGELCNFAAYGFVPATLVTPLGALSVLISAVMSAYFLDEKLNLIGKVGCILTAIGSTVMVIHAPKEGEVNSVKELVDRIQDKEFISFTILCIIALVFLIFYMAPKYGNTNVFIYILICSILGGFTVMSCKGLSLGIKEIFLNRPSISFAYTYFFAFLVISCIVIQMNYLNKSLDLFNTPIVTTIYYVLFTLFVMIASALLFKEFLNVSFQDFVGCICGFLTIICALFLIQFFKTSPEHTTHNAKQLDTESNKSYDSNLFNLILSNSKKISNDDKDPDDNLALNELIDTKIKNYPNNQEVSTRYQNSSDLVQKVTFFKTQNPNEKVINTNEIAMDHKPVSLIKKLTSNYKNIQNNFLFNKISRNSPGYKQVPNENDFDEEMETDDEESEFNEVFNKQHTKNHYNLLKTNDEKLNVNTKSSLRNTTNKRDPSKNISFDEKLLVKQESDESEDLNTTSQSLIILKS